MYPNGMSENETRAAYYIDDYFPTILGSLVDIVVRKHNSGLT